MDQPLSPDDLLQRRVRARLAAIAQQGNEVVRESLGRREVPALAVDKPKHALDRVAKPDRSLQHRVEYWG
jgi:hypothetical protein